MLVTKHRFGIVMLSLGYDQQINMSAQYEGKLERSEILWLVLDSCAKHDCKQWIIKGHSIDIIKVLQNWIHMTFRLCVYVLGDINDFQICVGKSTVFICMIIELL